MSMLLDWLMDCIACFALLPHVRSTPSCKGPWLRTTIGATVKQDLYNHFYQVMVAPLCATAIK
jgi:hypothetical protein